MIYTLQGDCNRALRYSLRIVNGRVEPEEQNYRAAGAVAPNGSVRVVVAEGGRSANGSGRLVGNSGRGSWRTDTGECSGQWTAVRRVSGILILKTDQPVLRAATLAFHHGQTSRARR